MPKLNLGDVNGPPKYTQPQVHTDVRFTNYIKCKNLSANVKSKSN